MKKNRNSPKKHNGILDAVGAQEKVRLSLPQAQLANIVERYTSTARATFLCDLKLLNGRLES